MVAPGATWVTEYEVTQRPMTAWYHPHPMHQTARQVYMGLAGVIYVDEPTPPADLPSTYGVDDLPLVIQDRRFFASDRLADKSLPVPDRLSDSSEPTFENVALGDGQWRVVSVRVVGPDGPLTVQVGRPLAEVFAFFAEAGHLQKPTP